MQINEVGKVSHWKDVYFLGKDGEKVDINSKDIFYLRNAISMLIKKVNHFYSLKENNNDLYFCPEYYDFISLENEIWKDIKGYEGLYQVSNLGRVKGLLKKCRGRSRSNKEFIRISPEIILKPHLKNNCYPRVCLYKNNERIDLNIHRLAAEAFIPNPENKPCVNHKDGNKQNNCVVNLEWCTHRENKIHSIKVLGLGHSRKGKSNDWVNKPVLKYDLEGNFIAEYLNIKEASLSIGKQYTTGIGQCANGYFKTSHGFIWKFKNN